jgi:hypothetical protein
MVAAGQEVARWTANIGLQVTTGNLVIGTSGKGIDFSATANAAGMTSELLDDYEEGTWTATLVATTNNHTYTNQTGSYTKIGRTVTAQCRVTVNSAGTTSGSTKISGLPFTSNSTYYGSLTINYANSIAITAGDSLTGHVDLNDVTVQPYVWDTTGGTTAMTFAEISAGGDLIFTVIYDV